MEAPAPAPAADSSPVDSPVSAPTTTTLLPPGSTWHKHGGEELEPLLAFTTLVDVRWLLKFAQRQVMPERKGVVPAWQELPAEAKLPVAEAVEQGGNVHTGVISHGWLARGHPDPAKKRRADVKVIGNWYTPPVD